MRIFVISAFAVTTFVATMTVDAPDANAVIYCRAVNLPRGCVVAPVAQANVSTVGVGAPGVGVRAGTPANRGGPVNRVGRR
jgi:hypothetical protein